MLIQSKRKMKRLGIFLVCLFLLIQPQLLSSNYTNIIVVERKTDSEPLSLDYNLKEYDCLAKNVYFEAGVETLAGKLAVAHVTMNRVKSDKYPNTVCDVVYQAKTYKDGTPIRHKCQFSWYCDGKPDKPWMGKKWEESKMVSYYILMNHREILDFTDGSLHYHAEYVNPHWKDAYEEKVRIGRHIFYK